MDESWVLEPKGGSNVSAKKRMKIPLSFFVAGDPKPGGSKTAFPLRRNGVFIRSMIVDASGPKGKNWRKMVSAEGKIAMHGQPLWECPVKVTFSFIRERPKSHLNSKGEVKKQFSKYPLSKPDCLKLARSAEDALTNVVWVDDAQVCDMILSKRYGTVPGVQIEIEEIE